MDQKVTYGGGFYEYALIPARLPELDGKTIEEHLDAYSEASSQQSEAYVIMVSDASDAPEKAQAKINYDTAGRRCRAVASVLSERWKNATDQERAEYRALGRGDPVLG